MEKKLDSCVMLTLLLTSMLTLAFNIQPIKAEPKTWTVDDDGPADFSRIQDSINAASDRDIIYVYNGTYYENIAVNKAVSLIGENRSITIIDGSGTGNVILVTADNVSISGFTIQNGGEVYPNAGIFLDHVTWSTIVNNNVSSNNGFGIFVMWGNDNNVSNNLVTFNGMNGIRVDVSRNILTNNIVDYNGWLGTYESSGIFLYAAFDCLIEGNTASNNRKSGIDVQGMSSNITIRDNMAENNGHNGIFHYGSLACSIEANTISNNGYNGIFIDFSDENSISHNTITSNNQHGIVLSYSSNNIIHGSNITANNGIGILLSYSSSNTVSENNITNNVWYGTYLYETSSNAISRNNIANNDYGIGVVYSSNSIISGNDLTENNHGIALYDSSNNIICHSNFVDNTEQVWGYESTNVWDDGYPSGGNYWSDHVTVDDCCGINQDEPGSDGIVDEPYIIDDYNRDNYPLVKPWSPVIPASVDIDPDTLNLRSMGTWITACIQLPEGYIPEDIDATTILLNGIIQPVLDPKYDFVTNSSEYLVDNNGDGILERMVKFDRATVLELILASDITNGHAKLTITGEVDGTSFEGEDTIKVLSVGGGSRRRKL